MTDLDGSSGRNGSGPRLARPESAPPETAPRAAAPLRAALSLMDRVLDGLHGSRWNPTHQSGSLALAFMLIAVASGLYLMFVYRIGAPYESMQRIQSQVWTGRWLRALHRYASDLGVVFLVLHALRMLAEGRNWGPRVLAWVTGLMLAGVTLVVGWTGYLLVWDDHALRLGAAGARLMDALHLMATPIGRVFGGDAGAPASFFFLNLFVHMALPLLMALLLWVHTLRLARSRWLPDRGLFLWSTVAVTALACVVPAPLGPAADGLRLGDRTTYDVFFTAWVPIASTLPASGAWALGLTLAWLPLSLPWLWRPRTDRRGEVSHHNPLACTGCAQCVLDCPFEAIRMVPNPSDRGEHEIAFVQTDRCVSCGLCAGSCDQLAIGPPARDGHAQMQAVKRLLANPDPEATVLVYCASAGTHETLIPRLRARGHRIQPLEVDCVGALHALAVSRLTPAYAGVFVVGCPPHRCHSREGMSLVMGRLLEGREPVLRHPLDPARVQVTGGSRAELDRLIETFERSLGARATPIRVTRPGRRPRVLAGLRTGVAVTAVLATIATLSQVRAGRTPTDGAIRLAWRLPGQSWEDCRDRTAEEIARMPAHMRQARECRTVYLHYRLQVRRDDRLVLDREIAPLGARGDRPLFVEQDLPLPPGTHRWLVDFVPVNDPQGAGLALTLDTTLTVRGGQARLITFDPERRRLVAR